MATGKLEGTLCDLVERELETTRRWCLSVGLRINSSKTTVEEVEFHKDYIT